MGFTTFGLSDHVIKGVQAAGYTKPTPIQSLAIQPALEGRDIIGCAQTGTGKTAAFVLPLLHRLAEGNDSLQSSRKNELSTVGAPALPAEGQAVHEVRPASVHVSKRHHYPRALVITPTRELAQQVHDAVDNYGRFMTLRTVVVYGGVSMENQVKLLRRGADIVIATPGRLLDHMQRRTVDLSKVQILVLDEADRMLDMGFIKDVRKIIGTIPKDRQTMLFSATISADIKSLASDILRDPQMVEAGEKRNPVETITQHFYSASPQTKMDLLIHALEKEKMESVLVFSRTKHGADKICRRLERSGINAVTIHSNRTQSQRQRALDGFKRGEFRVLVATDIAARGIDVEGISHVINYDIPQYAEDYIHRIGRTGRATATGDAITFVARDDQQHLRGIEKYTGKRFPVKTYEGFTPPPQEIRSPRPITAMSGPRHPMSAHPRPSGGLHASAPPYKKRTDKRYPPHPRKKKTIEYGRKKKPARKLDAFSSDAGSGWSNY